jgi:hypothetical protein
MDFSNYMFDNITGKVTDIKSDFRLAAMLDHAKKGKIGKETIERAEIKIREETTTIPVRPQDLPVKRKRVRRTSNLSMLSGLSFTDEELDGIDITNNHLFSHLDEQSASNEMTARTSS